MRNNAAYLPENPIVYIIFPESIHNRASLTIFAVENFRMGGQLFGVVRKIRHYVRCALSLYCK